MLYIVANYVTQTKKLHSIVIYNFTIKILKLQIVTILKNYPQGESNNQKCFICKVIYCNAMHFVDFCIIVIQYMKMYNTKFNYLRICKLDSENFIDEFLYIGNIYHLHSPVRLMCFSLPATRLQSPVTECLSAGR